MDYSFLAARLSFIFTCIFFSWHINSAAAIQKNNINKDKETHRQTECERDNRTE